VDILIRLKGYKVLFVGSVPVLWGPDEFNFIFFSGGWTLWHKKESLVFSLSFLCISFEISTMPSPYGARGARP
jgi:hypothetical protein